MRVRDTRSRKVKDAGGDIIVFHLRRLQCRACGQIHTEAPDIIKKNKHFSASVINDCLQGRTSNINADNKTLYRWRRGK